MIIVAQDGDIFNFDAAGGVCKRYDLDADSQVIKIWGNGWDKILGMYYGTEQQSDKIMQSIPRAYKRGARVYYMPKCSDEVEEGDT